MYYPTMPRISRAVAVAYPHHITQRGNYKWSSGGAHVYKNANPVLSSGCYLTERIKDCRGYLNEKEDSVMSATRFQNSKTGRHCGDETFIGAIEGSDGRRLAALSVGRPRKSK